jgi:hypothetical protein
MSRLKKNQPTSTNPTNQTGANQTDNPTQNPDKTTRGPNSATVVVSMKAALRSALQNAANLHLKSLSGMASHYVLEGLKRDGLLPGQNPPQHVPQQHAPITNAPQTLLTENNPNQNPTVSNNPNNPNPSFALAPQAQAHQPAHQPTPPQPLHPNLPNSSNKMPF